MASNLTSWKPGQSGNPKGRPKGSRHKLSEAFLRDLCEHWEFNGKAALDAALAKDPAAYVRVVAGLLPKKMEISDNRELDELTDAELRERIAIALERVKALAEDEDEEASEKLH